MTELVKKRKRKANHNRKESINPEPTFASIDQEHLKAFSVNRDTVAEMHSSRMRSSKASISPVHIIWLGQL